MTVSKRLRFEILRRDNHACRYCGRSAPDIELTVDHVVPVALGGSDDPSNLVAACADCNGGKSSVPADAHMVDDVGQDAARWAAAMRQAAEEFSDAISSSGTAYAAVDAEWYTGNRPSNWTDSIDQFIKSGLPLDVIVKMVGVAQNKRGAMGYRWSYFCGCCWARIREMQARAVEIVGNSGTVSTPPGPTAQGLATTWTAIDVSAELDHALSLANQHLPDTSIACVACPHQNSGCCADPVCVVQYATSLGWLALNESSAEGLQYLRDTAVMDEAEASHG